MSVTSIVSFGFSLLSKTRHVSKWKWGAGAIGGLAPLIAGTTGLGLTYYSMGHTYGTGTSALYAAASMYPITGIPLMLLNGTKSLGDLMYQQQKTKRQSSFVKNKINDKFGTIDMMRQYSGQQLRRDHTSSQRVLGNEASYMR